MRGCAQWRVRATACTHVTCTHVTCTPRGQMAEVARSAACLTIAQPAAERPLPPTHGCIRPAPHCSCTLARSLLQPQGPRAAAIPALPSSPKAAHQPVATAQAAAPPAQTPAAVWEERQPAKSQALPCMGVPPATHGPGAGSGGTLAPAGLLLLLHEAVAGGMLNPVHVAQQVERAIACQHQGGRHPL